MDIIKKHADSIAIILTVISGFFYMTNRIDDRFANLEKDIVMIKTVLIMQRIMPAELAKQEIHDLKK